MGYKLDHYYKYNFCFVNVEDEKDRIFVGGCPDMIYKFDIRANVE